MSDGSIDKSGYAYPAPQHVSATQAPPPGAIVMTQAQYNATFGSNGQPHQMHVQQPVAHGQPYQQPTTGMTGPPRDKWRDGICDWGSNLWPSCFCTCSLYGCGAAWLLSQVAQKTGYTQFTSIMRPFVVVYIVAWIVDTFFGSPLIYILLFVFMLIFSIFVRLHVAKTYSITENGTCLEILTGLFCGPCSLAQMARHVYGYNKVFDGDSDPERPDQYVDVAAANGDAPSGGGSHVHMHQYSANTGMATNNAYANNV